MEKTRAWELLNDPHHCGRLTMDGLYRLMLAAGYDKSDAQMAANQRGWDRLCAGEVM